MMYYDMVQYHGGLLGFFGVVWCFVYGFSLGFFFN